MAIITEQEYLAQIASAEREISDHKTNMVWYKSCVADTESRLIEAKIRKERLQESLRQMRANTNTHQLTDREKEIAAFKLRHPELCQMAEDRDKDPKKDDTNGAGS